MFSMIVFPLKRSSFVALVLVIPALTEIVQFFMPGRVPDFMDAFHGYLGITLAFCLVQLWREIAPVTKKIADLGLGKAWGMGHGVKRDGRDRRSGETGKDGRGRRAKKIEDCGMRIVDLR